MSFFGSGDESSPRGAPGLRGSSPVMKRSAAWRATGAPRPGPGLFDSPAATEDCDVQAESRDSAWSRRADLEQPRPTLFKLLRDVASGINSTRCRGSPYAATIPRTSSTSCGSGTRQTWRTSPARKRQTSVPPGRDTAPPAPPPHCRAREERCTAAETPRDRPLEPASRSFRDSSNPDLRHRLR